jgi:hypothetical protein
MHYIRVCQFHFQYFWIQKRRTYAHGDGSLKTVRQKSRQIVAAVAISRSAEILGHPSATRIFRDMEGFLRARAKITSHSAAGFNV